jgi:hypothetical protein
MSSDGPEGPAPGTDCSEGEDRRNSRLAAKPATHYRKTDRRAAQKPALAEPVVIAKFWRNRQGEAVIVQLREYEVRIILDARVNFTDREGRLRPSKKGLSVSVRRLPELCRALAKAEQKARELGLLDDEAGHA